MKPSESKIVRLENPSRRLFARFIQALTILGITLLAFAGDICFAAQCPKSAQPNIVFIMMDDLGYGSLEPYGSTLVQTPNLDAFVNSGEFSKFTQYYANAPVCSPTRVSILTGDYPHRLNVRGALRLGKPVDNFRFSNVGIPEDFATLPKMLQEEGYRTAHFGKWHIGQQRDEFKPAAAGFDEYSIRIPHLTEEDYWVEVFEERGSETGNTPITVCSNDAAYDEGQEKCADSEHRRHLTTWLADKARGFIERQSCDQPFFLNLWLRAPHSPFNPSPESLALYDDFSFPGCDENDVGPARNYAALVSDADTQIGEMLSSVDTYFADNTIVIVTSDNGAPVASGSNLYVPECLAPNGTMWRDKGKIWEGGNRVPLMVRWPGEITSPASDFPLASFDWYRTLSDILGRDLQTEPTTDGQSVRKQLLNLDAPLERDDDLVWETSYGEGGARFAVRRGRWKLTHGKLSPGAYDENDTSTWTRDRLWDMSSCTAGNTNCETEDLNLLSGTIDPYHQSIADSLRGSYFEWRLERTEIPWDVANLGDNRRVGELLELKGGDPVSLCVQADSEGCRTDHPFFDFHDASFTVSMFVKPTEATAGTGWIAGKSSSWRLTYRPDNRVRLVLWGDDYNGLSCTDVSVSNLLVLETDPLVLNDWNHIAFSVTGGTGAVRLFLNGVSQDSATSCEGGNQVLDVASNTNKVLVGSQFDGSEQFSGMVSHVRMFTAGLVEHEIELVASEATVAWEADSLHGSVTQAGDFLDFPGPGLGAVKLGPVDHPLFDVSAGPFTFSTNVRPRNQPSGFVAWLAGEEGSWRLSYRPDGKLRLRIENGSNPLLPYNLDSDTALQLEAWSHVAFAVTPILGQSGQVAVRYFIDGIEQASSGAVLSVPYSSSALTLGGHFNQENAPIDTFPGTIAGAQLFRDSLTSESIGKLALGEVKWDEGPRFGLGVISKGDFFSFEGEGLAKLCAARGSACSTSYPPFEGRDGSLTVSVDIRPDASNSSIEWIAGVNCAWRLSQQPSGQVLLRIYGDSCTSVDSVALISDAPLPIGEWSRVTFTLGNDGQDNLSARLYVRGVLQQSSSSGVLELRPTTAPGTLVLGGHSDGVNVLEGYSGAMRGIRIFLRELDQANISSSLL